MTTVNRQKVSEIDLKIKALQDKKKKLEEKQYFELAHLIKKTGAISLSPEILVGSLLDATIAFKEKHEILKKWQQTGTEFLKSGKTEGNATREKPSKDSFRKSSKQD